MNADQRHTSCSCSYYISNKPIHKPKCRFNYPFPEQVSSILTFEKFENGIICATLSTKRNGPKTNSHNRLQLHQSQVNIDFQIIIDM